MLFVRLCLQLALTSEPRLLTQDLDPAELYTLLSGQVIGIHSELSTVPSREGQGSVHLLVDNADKTRTTLDRQRVDYGETEVAKVMLANRSAELARVAPGLGDQGIRTQLGRASRHQ